MGKKPNEKNEAAMCGNHWRAPTFPLFFFVSIRTTSEAALPFHPPSLLSFIVHTTGCLIIIEACAVIPT